MAKAELEVMPPVRLVSMGVLSLAGIIFLPNTWWGLALKAVCAIILLSTVLASFGDIWHEYETMGAFVTVQLACFAAIMLFPKVSLITYIAPFIIILGWMTMLSRIRKSQQ